MAIDISAVDLRKFIADVYDLSAPQGMGFLHATPGPLDEASIDSILERGSKSYPVGMDYVHGRACKMTVYRDGDKLTINDRWYDHSAAQLRELLRRHDISIPS